MSTTAASIHRNVVSSTSSSNNCVTGYEHETHYMTNSCHCVTTYCKTVSVCHSVWPILGCLRTFRPGVSFGYICVCGWGSVYGTLELVSAAGVSAEMSNRLVSILWVKTKERGLGLPDTCTD